MSDDNVTHLGLEEPTPISIDTLEQFIQGYLLGVQAHLGASCPFKNLTMGHLQAFIKKVRVKYLADFGMPDTWDDLDQPALMNVVFHISKSLCEAGDEVDVIDGIPLHGYVAGVYNEPCDESNSFALDYAALFKVCKEAKLELWLQYSPERDLFIVGAGGAETEWGRLNDVLAKAPELIRDLGIDTNWERSPEDLHPETKHVIDRAFIALKAKMLNAQIKHGLDNGCLRSPSSVPITNDGRYFTSVEGCVDALKKHLQKGDILDAMAYLSILHTITRGADKHPTVRKAFM